MSIAEAPLPTDLTENADGAETLDLTPHENDPEVSDDDFHDLPSEFDDDDFPLDDAGHTNDDIEFLRSAAKTFMTSLSDMDDASANTDTDDAPRTLFYGDDYVVTIQNRQFAIAFLDYTQFRIDKQRNPDKFRLLASLKKTSTQRKRTNPDENRLDHAGLALPAPTPLSTSFLEPELLSMIGTKGNKKKRSKRNKRKRAMNQNNNAGTHISRAENCSARDQADHFQIDKFNSASLFSSEKTERTSESVHDEDDDEDNTTHVLNDEEYDKNGLSFQRLPHVYLDNDLKPCIVVAGEENGHETSEHEDWHDIKAGGKSAPVPKKSQNKKDQPRPEENLVSAKIVEEVSRYFLDQLRTMWRDVLARFLQHPRCLRLQSFLHQCQAQMPMLWSFHRLVVASFIILRCSKHFVCVCVDHFPRSAFVSNRTPIISPLMATWKPMCSSAWPTFTLWLRTNDRFVFPTLIFLRPRRAMSSVCNNRLHKSNSILVQTTIESFVLLLVYSIIIWNNSTINSSASIVAEPRNSFSSPICNFQLTKAMLKNFKQVFENAFFSYFRHDSSTSLLHCPEIWCEQSVGWASTRVWPNTKTWTKPYWSEKSIQSSKSTVFMLMCSRYKPWLRSSWMPIDSKPMSLKRNRYEYEINVLFKCEISSSSF